MELIFMRGQNFYKFCLQLLLLYNFYFVIFTEAFWPLPLRIFWYALNFAAGTLITAFAEIPLSADDPTVFSAFVLIVMEVSALHPLNACFPIDVTLDPILTLFSLVHPENALLPIAVAWNV